MNEHLIFFDDECPLCNKAVKYVLELDKHHRFIFAPLGGKTAADILHGPLKSYASQNSLVLIENYQSTERELWIRSRAILRIYWLVGNGWAIVGWLSFLPNWVGDFFYRWAAQHRHQFKLKPTGPLGPPDRFLP